MTYDPIRSRILPGVKQVIQSSKKYDVVDSKDEAKGADQWIKLTINDSVTVNQNAGSHTKRVTVHIDFHDSSGKQLTDPLLHQLDVIQDLLEKNPVKRSSAGLLQYFDGEVTNVDTEPTDEDDWVFRIQYEASHTKVHT